MATPKMFAKLTMLAPVTHNDHLYPTFQLTSLPGAKCILHLWHAVNFEETEVVALSATAGSDGVAPSDWLVPPKIYNYPWPYSIGPDDYYNTSAGNNRGYDSYCTLDGVKANIIRSFRWTADGPTPL